VNPEVLNYQRALQLVGFPIVADGIDGPFTRRAVGDFQGMCTWRDDRGKLATVDGRYGPQTAALLQRTVDASGRIAPNFRVREFACNCRFPWPDADRSIVLSLEIGRRASGKPVSIASGHRTHSHNIVVGGSSGSFHTCHPRGVAVHDWCDTSAVDLGNWRTLLWTEEFVRDVMHVTGGVGIMPSGHVLHIDNGPFRRWFYT